MGKGYMYAINTYSGIATVSQFMGRKVDQRLLHVYV